MDIATRIALLSGKLGKHPRTKILILAGLFTAATAIGCWAEFHPLTSEYAGALGLPGVFLSLCFNIGPHGPTWLFLWSVPFCNGIAYTAPVVLAFWLRAKLAH